MKTNSICYVEWQVTDVERSKKFLSGLFGWRFEDSTIGNGGYSMFETPEGIGGGIEKVDAATPGRSPLLYVLVEEIEPYLEKAKSFGGTIEKDKTDIPTIGWFALLKDHDGNVIGLFQSGERG